MAREGRPVCEGSLTCLASQSHGDLFFQHRLLFLPNIISTEAERPGKSLFTRRGFLVLTGQARTLPLCNGWEYDVLGVRRRPEATYAQIPFRLNACFRPSPGGASAPPS